MLTGNHLYYALVTRMQEWFDAGARVVCVCMDDPCGVPKRKHRVQQKRAFARDAASIRKGTPKVEPYNADEVELCDEGLRRHTVTLDADGKNMSEAFENAGPKPFDRERFLCTPRLRTQAIEYVFKRLSKAGSEAPLVPEGCYLMYCYSCSKPPLVYRGQPAEKAKATESDNALLAIRAIEQHHTPHHGEGDPCAVHVASAFVSNGIPVEIVSTDGDIISLTLAWIDQLREDATRDDELETLSDKIIVSEDSSPKVATANQVWFSPFDVATELQSTSGLSVFEWLVLLACVSDNDYVHRGDYMKGKGPAAFIAAMRKMQQVEKSSANAELLSLGSFDELARRIYHPGVAAGAKKQGSLLNIQRGAKPAYTWSDIQSRKKPSVAKAAAAAAATPIPSAFQLHSMWREVCWVLNYWYSLGVAKA